MLAGEKESASLAKPSLSPVAEAELVRRAAEGDSDAFARLYDDHAGRVYRYLISRIGVPAQAEDLTSEVFLRAWSRLEQYRPGPQPFAAWLFRIARNAMVDAVRREGRETDLPGDRPAADNTEHRAERRLRAAEVREALTRLTEEQRQVLELRFFAGLSTKEIARSMGKRDGAIRALQMRGLQALAGELNEGSG